MFIENSTPKQTFAPIGARPGLQAIALLQGMPYEINVASINISPFQGGASECCVQLQN
jgi:hypothetical protein